MPNKELRIIIADTSRSRLIQVEKSLNRIGYYRILPVQSFEDLRVLSQEFNDPFDVLIANMGLTSNTEIDLTLFCQTTRNIDHALLYGNHPIELTTVSYTTPLSFSTDTISAPSDELIEEFMLRIDPPAPWKRLKDLAWISNSSSREKRVNHQPTPCQT